MISILRKGFLLLVLLLFLALVGVLMFGGDRLFSHALTKYGPVAFHQPVRFAKAELSVLGGSAGVEQFQVGTEENPLLEFDQAAINIGTMALLDGRVLIENARLDGVLLHLVIREDGTLSFDHGPPPAAVMEADPMPPPAKTLPPQKNRDLVQIATEYWERYQHYQEYYDKLGSIGGDDSEASAEERVAFPGVPEYVRSAQQLAEGVESGVFWLEDAQITDFNWATLDLRNDRPLLPEIKDFSFSLQHIGTPPEGLLTPAVYAGKGELQAGGRLDFRLGLARDDQPSRLDLSAEGLPVASIAGLASRSFPFVIRGGSLDLGTTDLIFRADSLSGGIRIVLHGTTLTPKPASPKILGVRPEEFCTLLNAALKEQPIAFVIRLGGTPTSPSFTIDNQTDLGDLLGGAIKAEVERRVEGLVEEHVGELEDKVDKLLQDKLGDKLDLGGLFGGKKKDKDD